MACVPYFSIEWSHSIARLMIVFHIGCCFFLSYLLLVGDSCAALFLDPSHPPSVVGKQESQQHRVLVLRVEVKGHLRICLRCCMLRITGSEPTKERCSLSISVRGLRCPVGDHADGAPACYTQDTRFMRTSLMLLNAVRSLCSSYTFSSYRTSSEPHSRTKSFKPHSVNEIVQRRALVWALRCAL